MIKTLSLLALSVAAAQELPVNGNLIVYGTIRSTGLNARTDHSASAATRPFREVSTAPTGTCAAADGLRYLVTTGLLYGCRTDTSTWIIVGAGASTFDASAVVSGVFSTARLATGSPSATTILFGDGTWKDAATSRSQLGLGAAALLPIQGNGANALTASTLTSTRPLCTDAAGKAVTPTGSGYLKNDCTFDTPSGAGGGASASSQLTDFALGGVGTAALTVTCTTGRCNVAIGETVTAYTALAASCTVAGAGRAWIEAAGLVVAAASAPTCSGGATGVAAASYPTDGRPFVALGTYTFASGAIGAVVSDLAIFGASKRIDGSLGRVSVTRGATADAVDLVLSGVTAGTFTNATVTVDLFGRVTAASNGAGGGGGSPGGTVGQLQFHGSGGVFAGIANTLEDSGTLRWNTGPVTGGNLRFGTTVTGSSAHIGFVIGDGQQAMCAQRTGSGSNVCLGVNGSALGTLLFTMPSLDAAALNGNRFLMQPNSGTPPEIATANAAALLLSPAATAPVRLNTTGTKPTCTAGIRGALWYGAGGAGVLDTFEVCRKDAADAYAWVSVF
jgi:hypothetical protein